MILEKLLKYVITTKPSNIVYKEAVDEYENWTVEEIEKEIKILIIKKETESK